MSNDLTLSYVLSVLVALLMAVGSLAGLLYSAHLYPTEELRQAFVPNDVVNLLIGLPSLLGSMYLTRRGKLLGLLFWPGALFYSFYNYLVYALGLPLNPQLLLSLLLTALSAYTTIRLVASLDAEAIRQRLTGAVPARAAGVVLTILGAFFSVRAIVIFAQALLGHSSLGGAECALLVTDLLISPAWITGGVLLWRRHALGYVTGTGLLFQGSTLFIGLVVVLLLQPVMTDAPLMAVDIIVVLAMGLVCFVPFGLFLRGVASKE